MSGMNASLARNGLDNSASSMIVEGGNWLFCSEPFYRGDCRVLAPGRYRSLREFGLDRNISSLRPVAAADTTAMRDIPAGDIELYADADFAGASYAALRDVPNLGPTNFNDRAASVVVNTGQWELCTDGEYGGRCAVFGPGRYPALGGLTKQVSSLRRIR